VANSNKQAEVIKYSVEEVRFTVPVVAKVLNIGQSNIQVEGKLTVNSAESHVDMWLSIDLAELYKASGRNIAVQNLEFEVFTDSVARSKNGVQDESPVTFFNPWVYASGVMKFYREFNLL